MSLSRRRFLTGVALAPVAAAVAPLLGDYLGGYGPARVTTAASRATNFAALTNDQIKVWSRDLWREASRKSLLNEYASDIYRLGSGARVNVALIEVIE
jgi:hypothetical protein